MGGGPETQVAELKSNSRPISGLRKLPLPTRFTWGRGWSLAAPVAVFRSFPGKWPPVSPRRAGCRLSRPAAPSVPDAVPGPEQAANPHRLDVELTRLPWRPRL